MLDGVEKYGDGGIGMGSGSGPPATLIVGRGGIGAGKVYHPIHQRLLHGSVVRFALRPDPLPRPPLSGQL